jgi:hypothetical protein
MNTRRQTLRGFFLAIFIGLLLIISGIPGAKAQTVGQWTPDQRVSGYLDDTFTPVLLADRNRTVHAFASQWVNVDGEQQGAIVYRQWSLMGGWTKPVDILLSPVGDAQMQSAFIDDFGYLHVVFWSSNQYGAYIYYSKAPVASADVGSAWSLPIAIANSAIDPASAALAGDSQGNLIIIYSGKNDGAGVYEIRSDDSGETWSNPSSVFLTYDTELVPFSLRLVMGQGGQLHAAWSVVTNLGVDESLHYARFDLSTKQWTQPFMINKRLDIQDYFGPSYPAIVDTGKSVVIVYNNGNPFSGRPINPGRPVQEVSVSNDGGQTWNDPTVPFYRLVGRSGEHSMVVDSNNNAHTLFVQRVEFEVDGNYKIYGGIWHSELRNGIWSDPDRFITTVAPHDVRTVISQGNVLLAVWRQDPGIGQGGIWYSYTILDTPELPVVVPPNPEREISTTSNSDLTLLPTPMGTPTTASPQVDISGEAPKGIMANPAGPLIIAIIPVLIILLGALVLYQYYRHRMN